MVSAACLMSFCGMAVSLTLAVPLARLRSRSLYDSLTYAGRERERREESARAARQGGAVRYIFWRKLGPKGRCMQEQLKDIGVYSDTADLGWGATISEEMKAGVKREALQGLWTPEERSKTITSREICALLLVLQGIPRPAASGAMRPVARPKYGGAPRAQKVGAGQDFPPGRKIFGVPEHSRGGPRPKSPMLGRQHSGCPDRGLHGQGLSRAHARAAPAAERDAKPESGARRALDRLR